jgi:protein-tyrosine phosphatase
MASSDPTTPTAHTLPRSLVLEGASNVRDLGGWPTANGGRVAFGRVFRSAALARLTDADRVTLAEVGLRTVCDFRGKRERERAPSRLDGLDWLQIHSLPIEPTVGGSLTDILATREATGEDVLALLHRAYLAYVFDCGHRYAAMFELILQGADRLPLLFHCSAGKDRTGFGAALVLAALDVPWDSILADYLATNRLWRSDPELARELPPAVAEKLLSVHAELLENAFAAMRREFGSMDCYFETVLGLTPARHDRLRALLME